MKTIEITEQFLKDLYGCFGAPGRSVLEKHFPQLFEAKLEPGLYRDEAGRAHILCQDKYGDWRLVTAEGLFPLNGRYDGHFDNEIESDIAGLRQIMAGLRRVE